MRVYLKIHSRNEIETVAVCDESLINKVFKEGNLKIEISERFFGTKLIPIENALKILKEASHFNIVGKNIISNAIELEILPEEGVRSINGIPMALKMMF
ncbi:MAG: DUF424 family protein [Candidatus Lokiarchaeota archaeon]|nr:DUF424 family protein [Candidatus Lokiarchaeota archaeon]